MGNRRDILGIKEDRVKKFYIFVKGVLFREDRENKREMIFKEIIVENLIKLVKDMNF